MVKGNILELAYSFVVLTATNASSPLSFLHEYLPLFEKFSKALNTVESHLFNWVSLIAIGSVILMNYRNAKKSESETKANERKNTLEAMKEALKAEFESMKNKQ